MTLGTILLIVLILVLIGAIPGWRYSANWGYGPAGIIFFILIVFLVLVMLDKVHLGRIVVQGDHAQSISLPA